MSAIPAGRTSCKRGKGAVATESELPDLPPGRTVTAELSLTPVRRGYVRLAGLYLTCPDPLGLFKARVATGEAQSLLVLPRRYPVHWVEPIGASRDRVGGASQSASTGGTDEFAALREYRPGDPLRHIHWKGWARHATPIVKEFHEEAFARQALLLDTFLREDGTRVQFEEAVSVAASFACAVPSRRSVMDLLFIGTEVHRVTSGPGLGTTDQMLEALACVKESARAPFALLSDAVKAHAGELTGCICVLLDWNRERRRLIEWLRHAAIPVLVLVVLDPESDSALDPGPMADQPDRFHVLEAGAAEGALALLSNR